MPNADSNNSSPRTAAEWKTALDREKIINEYGRFVERRPPIPTRIEDVSVLPYPKETILSALLLEITRGDVNRTEALRVCARDLALFQAGVGREPLEMLGIDISETSPPPPSDIEALRAYARLIVEVEGKTRSRFEQFTKLVEADLVRIDAQIEAAVLVSHAIPEEQKKRILD